MLSESRGVLDFPNFGFDFDFDFETCLFQCAVSDFNLGCFVSSRCQHFIVLLWENSIKAGMNWHKIQEIEHTPAKCVSCIFLYCEITAQTLHTSSFCSFYYRSQMKFEAR